MTLTLRIWRQARPDAPGAFVDYRVEGCSPDMSFLELLDVLNDRLTKEGGDPVAFDYDCREGICGSCAMMIDGVAHGPQPGTTACQLFLRHFRDGQTIVVEPWRAKAFPIVKDLVVDRSAFDRIMAAGGFISVDAGSAPEANMIPVPKEHQEAAMDAAACIGCGACVAACKNASAALFVGAKVSHLVLLPQGHPERERRVLAMVEQMEREGFGACSNEGECMAVCPKEIHVGVISRLNREWARAMLKRL
ncbi:MAG TPA: succinate dehydrogenase/fumarate reductase iron-sulfur subunit [Candidatus Limnocylindria bacterium]|nr:succinate dehydrogenase/fumarate reductase iron-sulfur subunit [Candidatus Limnocylindria bacterium]